MNIQDEMRKYLIAQKNAMDFSVYIESEKARRNLRVDEQGRNIPDFFFKWIDAHSSEFRDAWKSSLCKDCENVFTCYFCLREECKEYNEK